MKIVCPSCKNKRVPYGLAMSQVFLGPRKGLRVTCDHCNSELVVNKAAVLMTAAIAFFAASVFAVTLGTGLILGFFLFLIVGLFYSPVLALSIGGEDDRFGLLPWITRGGIEKFLVKREKDFTGFIRRQKEANNPRRIDTSSSDHGSGHRYRRGLEGRDRHKREPAPIITGVHGDTSNARKHRYARGGEGRARHASLGSPERSSGGGQDHRYTRKPETAERHESLGSPEPMGSILRLTRRGRQAAAENAGRNYVLELREARVALAASRHTRILCPRCQDAYFEPRRNPKKGFRIRCPSCGLSDG